MAILAWQINFMQDYYEHYRMADQLLIQINSSPAKQFRSANLSKAYQELEIIALIKANGLGSVEYEGKHEILKLTLAGEQHLASGGYVSMLCLETARFKPSTITFKQHLNDCTNLLTIFGILNAVILFAAQKQARASEKFDFNFDGMQMISISMYLFSILVLMELIWSTLMADIRSSKVQAMYFLLCSTTVGMGMIFTGQYLSLLLGIGAMCCFFGLVSLLTYSFTKLLIRFFKKGLSKGMFYIAFIFSLMLMAMVVHLLIAYIKK